MFHCLKTFSKLITNLQQQQPSHVEPNGLLSYFAENPPVEEEVDIDAALNDQSLDEMMEPQPDSIDNGPMQIKVLWFLSLPSNIIADA